MLVLGIETSCDETGIALYHGTKGLLAQRLYSQASMHHQYGGVVPELASRDHIRRVLPLTQQVLDDAGMRLSDLTGIAYTQGPGLAGALLVGASIASSLAYALQIPVLGVHHLEGHLLSPLLAEPAPQFPFVALLVSGGHTQLMAVEEVGQYTLLGETLDDAAGEAFDKTAKLLGLPYPGGPALARLAERGDSKRFVLPRPMLDSGDLNFSFSGLKTAVLSLSRKHELSEQVRSDIAATFQEAIVDVLVAKSLAAVDCVGYRRLVVAGGVGANLRLRAKLATHAVQVFYPPQDLCTDNGAMIALVGALRLQRQKPKQYAFTVRPRWLLTAIDRF